MTTETTTQKQSNSLVYKTNKVKGKNHIYVTIRLNDECKNGHQDFAITADIYEAGKPKTDRYHLMGGCCHEEILKAYPEFKPFVDLHLCDYKGIPMHAGANGFYHLRNGFTKAAPNTDKFKEEFCEYYRVTPQQFDALNTSENVLQYSLKLQNLGILEQWEEEAKKAISFLEELTGTAFLIDSKRTQFVEPTKEQIEEEERRLKEGYYTLEAREQRKQAKITEETDKLIKERDDKIKNIETEYNVLLQVLAIGGKEALKNVIYYTHSKTLAFNWRGYDKMSDEHVNTIIGKLELPEGVKTENKPS